MERRRWTHIGTSSDASTCIKLKYQQQLQSIVEMHGAETLLFGVFAANTDTHRCRLTTTDTCTTLRCVSLTQQTSHSYLFCFPVCLPTVSSLLLLRIGFMWCELLMATSDTCRCEDTWGWKARVKSQIMYVLGRGLRREQFLLATDLSCVWGQEWEDNRNRSPKVVFVTFVTLFKTNTSVWTQGDISSQSCKPFFPWCWWRSGGVALTAAQRHKWIYLSKGRSFRERKGHNSQGNLISFVKNHW